MTSLESDTHKWQKRTTVSINAAMNVLRQAHSARAELEDTRKPGRKDVCKYAGYKSCRKSENKQIKQYKRKKHNTKLFVLYRDHIKIVMNQIRILTNVQLSYLKRTNL